MSRIRRGIVAIVSGAAGGQIIGLIATPIISRIYGPEVFGDFALIQAVASILVPLATLRLPYALLRPRDSVTVKTILVVGLFVAGFIAGVSALLVWVGSQILSPEAVIATGGGALWIFLMTWATAIFAFLSQAALRLHEYRAVAIRQVTQHGTSAFSQILFGLLSAATHVGLSAGRVLGLVVSCVPLIRPVSHYWKTKGWSKLSDTAKHYWQYPLLFTPSAMFNVLGTQLPLLLVSAAYTSDIVGQLGMSQRIALIPSALVGMAVSQVFASELSVKLRERRKGLRRQFLRFAASLAVLGLIVGLALFALGPQLIPFFLGDEWDLAGDFSRVMSVSIAIGIVASPLSSVFLVAKAAITSLVLDVTRVAFLLVAYGVAVIKTLGAVEFIALLYAAQALTYLITLLAAYAVVTKNEPGHEAT